MADHDAEIARRVRVHVVDAHGVFRDDAQPLGLGPGDQPVDRVRLERADGTEQLGRVLQPALVLQGTSLAPVLRVDPGSVMHNYQFAKQCHSLRRREFLVALADLYEDRLKACAESLGKVAPYGVYDIAANQGWVNLGIDADTGAFAVESIRRWWHKLGKPRYPHATRLTITAERPPTAS